MSITTKTGDKGTTGLLGGQQVSKSCIDIEAIGDIDELNSEIGVVRSALAERQNFPSRREIDEILEFVQNSCFVIGTQIASIEVERVKKVKKIKMIKIEEKDVARLEGYIEKLEKQLPKLHHFILPSGHIIAAQLFLTRAICRRAERSIVRLNKSELSEVLKFINRLSDFLFLLARFVNQAKNKRETIWSGRVD